MEGYRLCPGTFADIPEFFDMNAQREYFVDVLNHSHQLALCNTPWFCSDCGELQIVACAEDRLRFRSL